MSKARNKRPGSRASAAACLAAASFAAIVLALSVISVASADPFFNGPGGMKIKDLKPGDGAVATEGMVATIHFTGWLDKGGARGREIYNSRGRGEPVSFVIGTDGVMPAWNAGVLGMQPGGRRMLLVPPTMAYGNREIDEIIPANAAMQFIIELVRLGQPDG